jgi:hypothetical protein
MEGWIICGIIAGRVLCITAFVKDDDWTREEQARREEMMAEACRRDAEARIVDYRYYDDLRRELLVERFTPPPNLLAWHQPMTRQVEKTEMPDFMRREFPNGLGG